MKKHLLFFFAVVLLSICSCATKNRVEYRDINHYITKVEKDTLIQKEKDSVYIEVLSKGDTIYITKYKEQYKYRDKVVYKTDTCYKDSVVTVEKVTVKKVVPDWCYYTLICSLFFVVFLLHRLLKWLKII